MPSVSPEAQQRPEPIRSQSQELRPLKVKNLHNWKISYADARELQTRLSAKIRHKPLKKNIKLTAGLDCAFSKDKTKVIAAVVVLSMDDFHIVEKAHAVRPTPIPYIPGLLSFREAPACIAAVEKLTTAPNLFLIDGQGIAHPRRLGLASHLGLFLNKPTIGCAKSRLTGTHDQPGSGKGDHTLLKDEKTSETIGAVLRTRDNVKPLFVSVGHLCTLEDAIETTLRCAIKYRLPEPTRQAHLLVSSIKKQPTIDSA